MRSKIFVTIATLILSAPGFAGYDSQTDSRAKPAYQGYILSIDLKGPGSDELVRGNYDAAIDVAKRSAGHGHTLSAYLTLCAAYIRKSILDEAQIACNKAVELAKSPITTNHSPYGRANREGLAKAYTNRAVLRILQGNLRAANNDFAFAQRQNRHSEIIEHNMKVSSRVPKLANAK